MSNNTQTSTHRPYTVYRLCDPRSECRAIDTRYIGVTHQRLCDRLSAHVLDAKRRGDSPLYRWTNSLADQGLRASAFIITEEASGPWDQVEQFWVIYFRLMGCPLVNSTIGGNGSPGRVVSGETKAKQSAAQTGKRHTPEARARMSAAKVGRKMAPEQKAKMSAALKGRVFSPEHRANLSLAKKGCKGRVWSDASRAKLSASNKGRTWSPEARANLSAAKMGRAPHSWTPESRAKLSASNTGRKQSMESIEKMLATKRRKQEEVRSQ